MKAQRTLEDWRRETPGCANRVHLNNAGAGLMPRPVLDAIVGHFELEASIGGYEAGAARGESIDAAYAAVATLLGAESRNIAFVENATVAYAQALSAIDFQPGDVVLTTHADYISNQIMFLSLVRRLGIEVVRIPNRAEGGVDPEAVHGLIEQHEPRLVAVTHIPTHSGLVQDVRAIGEACSGTNVLYLVDACQSVGQLPLDVGEIRCDFLSATSRKFLRGPRGAGFLYASDRVLEDGLEPLYLDMRGARWVEPDRYATQATARRFENWEFAYALVIGTGAAARYALDQGVEETAKRTRHLSMHLRGLLADAGFRVLDRAPELGAIVMVEIPGKEPEALHRSLEAAGVNSAVSYREFGIFEYDEWEVDWALRLSPYYYNTEAEIAAAVEILAELRER